MATSNQAYQLIKVEGVNIYSSVYDTEQLSVIRGGSFLLKMAIEHIAEKFENNLEPLSTGASSGLFKLKASKLDNGGKLEELIDAISCELNQNEHYCYFTFIVTHSSHNNFQTAKEILIAKQRFLQLSNLTLAPDPLAENSTQVCDLQGNRAATKKNILPGNKKKQSKISRSVELKFLTGRDNRAKFYNKELNDKNISGEDLNIGLHNLKFTSDIQTLASCHNYPKLNHKIAVLYLDGNNFTSIQRKTVETPEQQRKFDKHIQALRKQFLCQLLSKLTKSTEGSVCFPDAITINNELRLETLLWGGDEMLFVVPAWLGFDLLYAFYSISAEWEYENEKLSHAGGLVFCSAKAPISKIRVLAQQLADEIKEMDYGRRSNYFDYLVLESIDYPVENSMSDFYHNQYGKPANKRSIMSPANDWQSENSLKNRLKNILNTLPKGQIYRLARQVISNENETNLDNIQDRLKMLIGKSAYDELNDILNQLFQTPMEQKNNSTSWRWVHLVELWDYLVPIRNSNKHV